MPSLAGKETPLPEPLSPLDTEPYRQNLKPVDFPPVQRPSVRRSAIDGFGPGDGTVHRDSVTGLSHGDEVRLLAENNIDLVGRPGKDGGKVGVMRALVVGATLAPSPHYAVHFSAVKLQPHGIDERIDTVSHAYSEFESNLQRQLVVSSQIGGGIPKIFDMGASYNDVSAMQENEREVTIHLQSSQFIRKAQIVVNRDHISLDPEFIRKVEEAISARDPAGKLFQILSQYGHFVPTNIYLGGRISLLTSDKQSDRSKFETAKHEFGAAAKGRFTVDAIPLKADGSLGVPGRDDDHQAVDRASAVIEDGAEGRQRGPGFIPAGYLGKQVDCQPRPVYRLENHRIRRRVPGAHDRIAAKREAKKAPTKNA